MKSDLHEEGKWVSRWRPMLIGYALGLFTLTVYMETQLQCYRIIVIDKEPAQIIPVTTNNTLWND